MQRDLYTFDECNYGNGRSTLFVVRQVPFMFYPALECVFVSHDVEPFDQQIPAAMPNAVQEDTAEECKARLEELARSIRAACEKLRGNPEAALPAAFVSFHTRAAQVTCMLNSIPWCMRLCCYELHMAREMH